MDLYLIFDLGGTSVKYAVSDKDGAFDRAGLLQLRGKAWRECLRRWNGI